MSLVVCDSSLRRRDRDERRLFWGVSVVAAGLKVRIGVWASGRNPKRWKTKMLSFRLEMLGSLAREVVVLEKVEQLGGLDAMALEKSAGLRVLKTMARPVMEESALEASWGLGGWEAMILLEQKKSLELKKRVWRREVLERGNTWASLPP